MFAFTFGDVGSGKSLAQADQILICLKMNKKFERKYKLPKREIWTNSPMSKDIMEKNKGRIFVWSDPMDMIFADSQRTQIRTNFDCFWDELAVELPSGDWQNSDPEIRRFFAQHRKRGIRIWGNTQDYMMVDINARRMATHIYQCHKAIGSRDPSPTLPPIKHIWGLILVWQLEKTFIRQDDQKRKKIGMPYMLFITKKLCQAYDTSYDIFKAERTMLKHIERKCPVCGIEKLVHI